MKCSECQQSVGMGASRCRGCGSIHHPACPHECDARPAREVLHMLTATLWAKRSICKRAQVGCVITTADLRQILAFGYNGPAKGLPSSSCRGREGGCGCLHAEDNACLQVDSRATDKVAFTTTEPCRMCAQRLVNAGVRTVYYDRPYRNHEGLEVLKQCRVTVYQLSAGA